MTDRDAFLTWVTTVLHDAEVALHNGDAAPRRAIWSRNEPVSVFGAWRNAHGQDEIEQLFASLASSFSDCTSYRLEVLTCDVVGDVAYTAALEHTSASIDGEPQTYRLRVTQVYRREGGEWKVAHRHGDNFSDPADIPASISECPSQSLMDAQRVMTPESVHAEPGHEPVRVVDDP
jgi:ketosteroid isomerase-like protein